MTVFLSHNISLQLSNSEGGGGNSYVRTHSSQMPFFFFKEKSIVGARETQMFFFSWVIMDSIALKSVDLWVGNAKQTNRNRVMHQPDDVS